MRATWLTDIHLNFLRPHALAQFYARVKAEQPDALLVTGDIAEADSVVRFLNELVTEIGAHVYFNLGNHDYYSSNIRVVRDEVQRASPRATFMQTQDPFHITPGVVMLGVDGWGDARCGDLDSKVMLSDWKRIDEFRKYQTDKQGRIDLLNRLGSNEARALHALLGKVPAGTTELLVLTHVPPFAEACFYDGKMSDPSYLPWFTCIATGEVLLAYAAANPDTRITVLCGHTHGAGVHVAAPNLEVRTGGWGPGEEGYGNPIVQATLEL